VCPILLFLFLKKSAWWLWRRAVWCRSAKDCEWIAVAASVEHYTGYSDLAEYTVVYSNFLQARNLQYVDFACQGETP
jgi:hypothetical protein